MGNLAYSMRASLERLKNVMSESRLIFPLNLKQLQCEIYTMLKCEIYLSVQLTSILSPTSTSTSLNLDGT